MKKTKSTLKHRKQYTWLKLAVVGIVLSVLAVVVAGLQYGVGPVAQMTGKSPTIYKLTEVVASGNTGNKTVTVTQTQAQERRGTGTVTNTETGTVIRQTDNVENPFSPIPKASAYCSSTKEKECSSKGQRCIISVSGGECQDIPGANVQPPTTPVITATGASCAGKWTSIGSGSWAQWGGTKNPNTGKETGSQVCIQCVDGAWKTQDFKLCKDVPYIPRPDEVIEKTVSSDQYACFANGTWYSTGSNTGEQTCSKGHWCGQGQEWNGTACVKVQTVATPSTSQYQPESCTPGNTWCEGNNLGTCTANKSKSYSYCPNTPGMTCVQSSNTKAECKVTGSATTGNIALSYSCGSGAGGTKLSIEKQSNGVTIYRQCDSKGCGLDGKCIGTTLGPINPSQPPTTSNSTSTTSTFACGSNAKGAISTEKKSDGTSIVHQCGTKGCGSNGKCIDAATTTQASTNSDSTTNLSASQRSTLANQSQPWSALNPMRVNSSSDCPAGSNILSKSVATTTGFKTTYECTPKLTTSNQQGSTETATIPVTQAATTTLTAQQIALLQDQSAPWSVLNPMQVTQQSDCPVGSVSTKKSRLNKAGVFESYYECTPKLSNQNTASQDNTPNLNARIVSSNAVTEAYQTGATCANTDDCRKCPGGIFTRLQVAGQAFPTLVCGKKEENSNRANATTTVASDNSSQYTLSVGQVCNDGIFSSNKCSKCPVGTYSTVLPNGNAGPNGAGVVKVCGSPDDLKSTDLSSIEPSNSRGKNALIGGTVGGVGSAVACGLVGLGCGPLLAGICVPAFAAVCGLGGALVGSGIGASLPTSSSVSTPAITTPTEYAINGENRGKACTIGGDNNCYDYCPSNGTNAVFKCDAGNKNCKCAE